MIELRRKLESGAADLAAPRISAEELEALCRHVATRRASHRANDVREFVEADLAFHAVILRTSGNVFRAVLFDPLSRVLAARRTQTSRVLEIQVHTIKEHTHIAEALKSGSPGQARIAMDIHMTQTMNDLKKFVPHV